MAIDTSNIPKPTRTLRSYLSEETSTTNADTRTTYCDFKITNVASKEFNLAINYSACYGIQVHDEIGPDGFRWFSLSNTQKSASPDRTVAVFGILFYATLPDGVYDLNPSDPVAAVFSLKENLYDPVSGYMEIKSNDTHKVIKFESILTGDLPELPTAKFEGEIMMPLTPVLP
ncbi:hypothetical protein ACIPF8_19550 [Collimonas sp. NPDC087041]|uniref:hypothetical protein n=1 Tax=Collimonas sp. NPDC087041 TaxID=3363960 RepID=UPI0037F1752E